MSKWTRNVGEMVGVVLVAIAAASWEPAAGVALLGLYAVAQANAGGPRTRG